MGSPRTKASTDAKPSEQSMKKAREVVQDWEREHTHNEDLILHVARALDETKAANHAQEGF